MYFWEEVKQQLLSGAFGEASLNNMGGGIFVSLPSLHDTHTLWVNRNSVLILSKYYFCHEQSEPS